MLPLVAAMAGAAQAQVTEVDGIYDLYDKVLSIQPIQVCNSSGSSCPSMPIYPTQLIQTLAKAGIATAVLPTNRVFDTSLNGVDAVQPFLDAKLGISKNWGTLNAWFVPVLHTSEANETLYGLGMIGGNGIAIHADAVTRDKRQDTFVHEVGHNLGLDHDTFGAGDANNLMTEGKNRTSPASGLTTAQIAAMRSSPFLQEAPRVTIDYDYRADALTLVTVRFDSAPADVRLRSLAIDLPDFIMPGVPDQLPASFSAQIENVSGTVLDYGFSYTENMQTSFTRGGANDEWSSTFGGPELVIDFGVDGMDEGQELTFEMGVVGNLRGEWSYPIGRDLYGGDATFAYDFGLTGTVAMADADSTTDSRALRAIGPSVADPAAFGRQLLPGEYGPLGPVHLDPIPTPVPEPASALLLLGGGAALLAARRRSRRPAV